MEFNNFEYLKEFAVRYNDTSKKDWFNAFLESIEKIKSLEDESVQFQEGFEYWQFHYNELKSAVKEYLNNQKNENLEKLDNLIK